MFGLFGKSEKEEEPEENFFPPPPVKKVESAEPAPEDQPPEEPFRLVPVSELQPPVKFDDLTRESRSVLSVSEIFDGFRCECTKSIMESETLSFQAVHMLALGSTQESPSYNFGSNLLYEKTVLSGRIDTDGHLMGRWNQELTSNLVFRASGQASPEPHQSNAHLEVEYKGSNWFGCLKWSNPGLYGISFTQAITPSLTLGTDLIHHHKQGITMLSGGLRFDYKEKILTAIVTPGHLATSYTYKVSPKVSFSSELTLSGMGTSIASTASSGLECFLRLSHVKARVDTDWKVHCMLEEAINTGARFAISGELDHKKKNYRFGFGFFMQV